MGRASSSTVDRTVRRLPCRAVRSWRQVTGACALLLLAGTASACGGSGGEDASTTSTTVAPAPSVEPGAGACATFRGAEAPRASTGPTAPGLLTGATAGGVGCLDQVE